MNVLSDNKSLRGKSNRMIDFARSFSIEPKDKNSVLDIFGRIDETRREIVLHYEMKSIGVVQLEHPDFERILHTFMVTSTDASTYFVCGFRIFEHTVHFSHFCMGTIKGRFESLIQHPPRELKFSKLSFSFQGIESLFPMIEIGVKTDEARDTAIIYEPEDTSSEIAINETMKGAVKSVFQDFPHSNCTDIHVTQAKTIEVSFDSEQSIEELMQVLWMVKHYIEFLLSQEIRLFNIQFFGKSLNDTAKVVADPIMITNTPIREVDTRAYPYSEKTFFEGLGGWLKNYDKYGRVIEIWLKTIYNAKVSPEDIYIWKCQAFELFCELTETIKAHGYSQLEPRQSYPNLRNYLISISSLYGIISNIATNNASCFMDAKDVRNDYTHHNPNKPVTDTQVRNATAIINHCLPAIMSKVIGFQCNLPLLMIVIPNKQK